MKYLLVILLAISLLISCSTQPEPTIMPTPTSSPSPTPDICLTQDLLDDLQNIAKRFDDANLLASSTPRMQLATVIQTLQEIRLEMDEFTLPSCALNIKNYLLGYMDATINGYIAFLGEDKHQPYFDEASQYFDDYQVAIGKIFIADGLVLGGIKKANGAIQYAVEQILEDTDNVTYIITNNSDQDSLYTTLAIAYKWDNGEVEILAQEYFSDIQPGEQVSLSFNRNREYLAKGLNVNETYITVIEAYVSTSPIP